MIIKLKLVAKIAKSNIKQVSFLKRLTKVFSMQILSLANQLNKLKKTAYQPLFLRLNFQLPVISKN